MQRHPFDIRWASKRRNPRTAARALVCAIALSGPAMGCGDSDASREADLGADEDESTAAPTLNYACTGSWQTQYLPDYEKGGRLSRVLSTGKNEAWAVGGGPLALILRWDGRKWSEVALPRFGRTSELTSLVARGTDDVRAAGAYVDENGITRPLILHWDGTEWTREPAPEAHGLIHDLTVSETGELWAVGARPSAIRGTEALVLRLTSDTWVDATDDAFPQHQRASLHAARGVSSGEVWTAGEVSDEVVGLLSPFAARWEGDVWRQRSLPLSKAGRVSQLLETAPDNLWAIGTLGDEPFALLDAGEGFTARRLASVSRPASLRAIAALSAVDVWAVGEQTADGKRVPMLQHWNGREWSLARGEVPGASATLRHVGPDGQGGLWAVGESATTAASRVWLSHLCPILVEDDGFAPIHVPAQAGHTVAFHIADTSPKKHALADTHTLELVSSSLLGGSEALLVSFPASGTYELTDYATGASSFVHVALEASPREGNESTTFAILWAQTDMPEGYVEDLQIKRPGEAAYNFLLKGHRGSNVTFRADAGPGSYYLRARIRNLKTRGFSAWSPRREIVVE